MADQEPKYLGSKIANAPMFPDLEFKDETSYGEPASNLSFDDMFDQSVKGAPKSQGESIRFADVYTGDRYASSRPGEDLEEMYAQQQGISSKFLNGAIKMTGTAMSSFLAGTAGLLYGIGKSATTGRLADIFDNEVNRYGDDLNKQMEDQFANYYTHKEQDAQWYSTDNVLTANFWSDKVMKNLGYSLGALGGGMAWAKVLGSMGVANRLVQAGRGMETATAIEEAMSTVPNAAKYSAFDGALTSLAQKYLKNPAAQILKTGDRITTSVMGSLGEASIEGLQNMNEFRTKAIEEFKMEHGRMPDEQELQEINNYADSIGKWTVGANALLLTATNYVTLPKILGSSRRAEKSLINDIEQTEFGGAWSEYMPKTKLGKYAARTRNVLGLGFAPSEAFEEGAQFAIQTGVNNYFDRAYKNKGDVDAYFTNLYGTMGAVFGEGVEKALTTKEGLESILIGGISGGIQQARGTIQERGIMGEGGFRRDNTQIAIDALNQTKIQDMLNDQARYAAIGIGSQKARQTAIINNDIVEEKDAEHDFMLSYIMPRVKYGKEASVKQELDYYAQQASTKEGFDQLITDGIALPQENQQQFVERIEALKSVTDSINSLYDALTDRYSDVVNEDGQSRMYSDSVIDKMVYSISKINEYDKRIPKLNQDLLAANISTQEILESIVDKGKNSNKLIKDALSAIDKLKTPEGQAVVSEVKTELKEKLNDIIELTERRKQFVEQYDDIKKNPEAYDDPYSAWTGPTSDNPAIINQPIEGEARKSQKKELEIGKEYSLVDPFVREGNGIHVAPKITVLSTTLGKQYETKLPNGKIEYLTPAQFRKYEVSDDDNTSPELSKLFDDAINTVLSDPKFKDIADGVTEGTNLADYVNNLDNKELMDAVEKEFRKTADDLAEQLKKQREEEQALRDSEELEKQMKATLDNGVATESNETGSFEAISKKRKDKVPTSTLGSANVPGYKNANDFGFNYSKFPKSKRESIRGVYITAQNEDKLIPGLTQYLKDQGGEYAKNVKPEETIALVMVKQEGNDLIPVDSKGNPIADAKDYLKNGVYQVKPTSLKWTKAYKEGGDTSMFREGTPQEEIDVYNKNYTAWRAATLKSTELNTHEIGVSFGRPEINKDKAKRTSVVEAALINEDDLLTEPVIVVPTQEGALIGDTTEFLNPVAKAFLKVGNDYVRLRNRKLTSKEAEVIYKVIHKLATNVKNDKGLSPDSLKLTNWLKSVTYWGTPKTAEGGPKEAGYNSIWFDAGKLMISNGKKAYSFTPSGLENKKDEIIEEIAKLYNNVNNTMISNDTMWPNEYTEITDVDSNGNLKTKLWDNYQTYLLSRDGRLDEELPLSTDIVALPSDTDRVNRQNIYFFTTDEAAKFVVPISKPETKFTKKITPGKLAPEPATTAPAGPPTVKTKVPGFEFDLTGSKVNDLEVEGIGTIYFVAKGEELVATMNDADKKGIYLFNGDKEKADSNKEFKANLIKARGYTDAQANAKIKEAIIARLNQVDAIKKFGKKQVRDEMSIDMDDMSFDMDDMATDMKDQTTLTQKDEDDMQLDMDSMEDDPLLRAVISDPKKNYVREDWKKLDSWFKENFPNLPVYRVKNIINATNGLQAWGMLQDGAIYLYENAEVGTAYHEVFEAVWKMFASNKEKVNVINEFRNREGSFVDRPTGRTIEYKKATPQEVKEQLAEEFRDYVMKNEKPKAKSFIAQLFSDLVDFIKEFFVGPKAQINTKKLFEKIGTGYYKQYSPYHASLSFAKKGVIDIEDVVAGANAEFRIENFTGDEQHDLIQHMTYLTLYDIVKNNKSLFTTEEDTDKTQHYEELRKKMAQTVAKSRKEAESKVLAGEMLQEEADPIINKSKAMYKGIKDDANWEKIIAKHTEKLKSYNIEFDENDNLQRTDEDNSGRADYQSAEKIDLFRKANPAIKLLLSTVPLVRTETITNEVGKQEEAVVPVYSSINGVTLMPTIEVFMTIMNSVHTARNLDEMMVKLQQLAKDDVRYRTVYQRITKKDYTQLPDLSQLDEMHDIQLVTALWKSFKKEDPDVKNVFILDNGDIVVGDSNFSTAAKQQAEQFINKVRDVIKDPSNPYFVFNKKTRGYVSKPSSVKDITLNTNEQMVDFLKTLKIEFEADKLNSNILTTDEKKKFTAAVRGIRDSIKGVEGKKIATITGKTLGMTKRLRQLGELKAKLDNPEFNSTYFNVKGERTQTFIGTNVASDLHDMLSQINNINELKGTNYEYLITDAFAKNSVILSLMFNPKTGEKRGNIQDFLKTSYADGTVNSSNGKKKQSSKLSYKDRIIQEFNMNLDGYYANLVPGDASLEWMLKMGNPIDEKTLIDNGYQRIHNIFRGYFIDEVNLARDKRHVAEGRKATDMRFFKDILTPADHDRLIYGEENSTKSAADLYTDNQKAIDDAVTDFINKNTAAFNNVLIANGILTKTRKGTWNVENINFSKQNGLTEEELSIKMTAVNASYIINNIELHKLLYSDPYQYKDELKRIKNFNSPRQSLIHGSKSMNKAIHRVYNRAYRKGDIGFTDFVKDHFRTITLADVRGSNKALNDYLEGKGYNRYKETDGGGLITFAAHRNFRIRASDWSEREELQYRYDVAYEKNKKDKKLSQYEEELLAAGNPQVTTAYTPSKPIVAGNKANGRNYNDVVLDKFALFPISYRILDELNNNGLEGKSSSNMIKLYDKMMNENIDYAIFESGRKVGTEKVHSVYDENGNFNNEPFETEEEQLDKELLQGVTNVPFSIMSVQSEVPSKDEALITRGSQTTKLITMDFMEAGVPIDFMEDGGSISKRYEAWIDLTEDEKKEQSPLYKEIKTNQDFLEKIMQNGFERLLKKFGITESIDEATKKKTFKITNFDKVVATLRDEMLKREVNDNITLALDSFLEGKAVLEATPAYQQIRNILYSIADKNVISPKISGGMKVQIPQSFLEETRTNIVDINGKKGFASDNLKFYRNKDGQRVCEIIVARWFESEKTDKELLDEWYETDENGNKVLTEEGKKVLTGLGFRIPTQKQNSIDAFVIKQFLPKEYGDGVVVPAELVEKAGSDFDIDKLNLYFKNVYTDINGKTKAIEYQGSEEATREYYGKVFDELNANKDAFITKELAKLSIDELDYDTDYESLRRQAEEDLMIKQEKLGARRQNFVDNMYKKSLENGYIQSSENLVTHPKNFGQLVKPNSAAQLEKLSREISKKRGVDTFDYKAVGNMLNRAFMTRLRQAFVNGKQGIGIAAVNQTNHSLNQRQLIYIDEEKMRTLDKSDKKWIGDGKIKFEKYNKIVRNGKVVPTLSMIKDALNKDFISDINGQFIDGYVDISNGPWIMELGATPNVTSTYMFLVKLGVPITTVSYFMNQPIIRDYLRMIDNAGYSWLFIDDYVKEAKGLYKTDKTSLNAVKSIPNNKDLWETIGKKNLSKSENAKQQFMLDEFLKYAKMAEHLFLVTQGSNFDTADFSDPYLVFKKQMQLKKAQGTLISSVDDVMNNSFLGEMYEQILDVRDALSTVLLSDQSKIRSVVEKVLTPYVDLPDREFVKVARQVVNDLFDWSVQTNTNLNSQIDNLMINNVTNAATQVLRFVESIGPGHALENNAVIKAMDFKFSETEDGVNNISIKNKDNKVYDQNQMIYGFEEIKNYLKGQNNLPLYGALVRMSMLQSGLSNSPISFTALLPYEDFNDFYNSTISKIEEMSNLEDFHTLSVFERNNWSDDDIVPRSQAKWRMNYYTEEKEYNTNMTKIPTALRLAIEAGEVPAVLKMPVYSREGRRDVIAYSWKDMGFTKAQVEEDLKEGNYNYMNKGLFQKVYLDDARTQPLIINNQYIYKQINAWGDSYRLKEFYAGARASQVNPEAGFQNTFIQVKKGVRDSASGPINMSNEVSDARIIPFFTTIQTDQNVVPSESEEDIDEYADETTTEAPSDTIELRDGNIYNIDTDTVTGEQLLAMGYNSEEANEILKKFCPF